MRILQAPTEIAGQMALLSEHLRKLGHKCTAYNFRSDIKIEKRAGVNIPVSSYQSVTARLLRALFFIHSLLNYDYFHFHYGRTFLPKRLDLAILKSFNKKIIMHFHGSDIRNPEFIRYQNDKLLGLIKDDTLPLIATKEQKLLIYEAKKQADVILVSTPDLFELVGGSKVKWFPNSINLDEWKTEKTRSKSDQERVLIVHAPSKRWTKGTDIIISVIKQLQDDGLAIDFKLVENTPLVDVRKTFQKADIVIDQLLVGWYGVSGIEAMALNKPVVCYMREDLVEKFTPDVPIYNAGADNLKEALKLLVSDDRLRKRLGDAGRGFVEKYHDVRKNAKVLEETYSKI